MRIDLGLSGPRSRGKSSSGRRGPRRSGARGPSSSGRRGPRRSGARGPRSSGARRSGPSRRGPRSGRRGSSGPSRRGPSSSGPSAKGPRRGRSGAKSGSSGKSRGPFSNLGSPPRMGGAPMVTEIGDAGPHPLLSLDASVSELAGVPFTCVKAFHYHLCILNSNYLKLS